MLPSLSPLSSDGASAGSAVQVPPPPRFRAIAGKPRSVQVEWTAYQRSFGNSVAKENGLRYEEKVQRKLSTLFPGYLCSPQITFRDDSGLRICRPDGLLPLRGRAVLFEIKIQHMPEAWWQLKRLYQPLIEVWCPEIPVQLIEVVRSFDPAMPFPARVDLISNLELWVADPTSLPKFGVFPWKL